MLLGDKTSANYVQYDGSTLTVRGDISVDAIRTPATIAGAPSTTSNASASIDANGFAKFVSASIGGFDITDNTIGSIIPASSSTSTTNTNVTISFVVPPTTVSGQANTTVTGITTTATSGTVFTNAYIKANSSDSADFSVSGDDASIAQIGTIDLSTGALVLRSPQNLWGTYYDEAPISKTYSLYTDSGASNQIFVSSSTQTTNFPVTQSIVIDSANQRIIVGQGGGSITASAGLIGGTEISGDSLQSTNDISPTPTAGSNGKAFQLKSDGTISGSALYIREVISTDGTNNIVYPLFDSEQGLVDGKNVGRNLASNYVEYVRNNADDGLTTPFVANQHFFQLMPYETTILVNAQTAVINGAETGVVTGLVKFVAEKLENSGSFNSGAYTNQFDNWVAVDTAQISVPPASASPWTGSYLATYDKGATLDIPEADQASPIRISVQMGVNPNGTAGISTSNKTILKGYTLTATRALSVASAGNPGSALPSKTS